MMKRQGIDLRPTETVPAVLQAGAGRWLLLMCPSGHGKKQFSYGEWTEARKRYGRKGATVECAGCYDGRA